MNISKVELFEINQIFTLKNQKLNSLFSLNSETDLGISSAFALRMQSGQSDSKENQAPKDGK